MIEAGDGETGDGETGNKGTRLQGYKEMRKRETGSKAATTRVNVSDGGGRQGRGLRLRRGGRDAAENSDGGGRGGVDDDDVGTAAGGDQAQLIPTELERVVVGS